MADESSTGQIAALGAAAAAAAALIVKSNGGITNVLNTFVSSSFAMSKAASSGAASLSEMGGAVGQLASLLGPAGTAFAAVLNSAIAALEKNIETHKTLSNVGATFGGNLVALRATSNLTYLSLEQFGKVVGENSNVLATFRGGVQAGTEFFAQTQRILLAKGSETGAMMANLGVGFQEAAEMTAMFMRGQGAMNKNRQMSETEIAQATARYAVELTALSDLTGQSRKALAEKVNEEMAEAQFQNYLASLDPEEAKKLQAAVTQELAVTGKAGADALKAQAAGFPPMTQAARLFTATQEASVARQQELITISRNSNIKYEEAQSRFSKSLADSIPGMREDFDKIRTVLLAGGLQGGTDLSKAIEQIVRTLTATTNKTPEEIKRITDDLLASAKHTGSGAAIGADYQKQIIDQSNSVLMKMQGPFDMALAAGIKISGTLNSFAGSIAERLPAIMSFIQTTLDQLRTLAEAAIGLELSVDGIIKKFGDIVDKIGAIAKTGKDALLGDPAARQKFFADLKAGWDDLMKYIKETIPSLSSIFKNMPSFGGTGGGLNIQQLAGEISRELKRELLGIGAPSIAGPPPNAPPPAPPGYSYPNTLTPRASGGATTPGSYLVGEEGPEIVNLGTRGDVINNDNLTAMISALSNQNGMGESIDQLNNTNGQMLSAIRDLIDISKRTLTATKGLNGNLFAA